VSALQTHLQGIDWAVLAIMPEKRHRAALLSRLREAKLAWPTRVSKPKPSSTRQLPVLLRDAATELTLALGGAMPSR
jgi:hypothetical protein